MIPPRLQALPPGLHSLADHEAHARWRMDPALWAWFNSGSADGHTLAANLQAWAGLTLLPRVLQRVQGGHTRTALFGRTLQAPLLLAPVAFQRLAHPEGELASVQAAAAQGCGYVLSTQASTPLESVAAAVRDDPGRGPLWFQLYFQGSRQATLELVRRAEAAGFEALVLTVDAPVQAPRDAIHRSGFRLPPGLAVNLPARSHPQVPDGGSPVFDGLMAAAPGWDDLGWLRAQARIPLLLKGVAHPDDARRAVGCGVAGLVVSNHGGRALDTVPSTAALLPALAAAVDGRIPVLLDGGIRRGTDVLKALALGAHAVLVGRPLTWGLANAGAVGVAHVLRLLRDELEIAMALCGCATPQAVGPELLGIRRP